MSSPPIDLCRSMCDAQLTHTRITTPKGTVVNITLNRDKNKVMAVDIISTTPVTLEQQFAIALSRVFFGSVNPGITKMLDGLPTYLKLLVTLLDAIKNASSQYNTILFSGALFSAALNATVCCVFAEASLSFSPPKPTKTIHLSFDGDRCGTSVTSLGQPPAKDATEAVKRLDKCLRAEMKVSDVKASTSTLAPFFVKDEYFLLPDGPCGQFVEKVHQVETTQTDCLQVANQAILQHGWFLQSCRDKSLHRIKATKGQFDTVTHPPTQQLFGTQSTRQTLQSSHTETIKQSTNACNTISGLCVCKCAKLGSRTATKQQKRFLYNVDFYWAPIGML